LAALLAFAAPPLHSQTPGSLDLSFDTGSTVDGAAFSVVPAADGKIYAGGTFSTVRGAIRNRIARLNAGGTADLTFDPGTGANGSVNAVAVQSDGKVLIGGTFTSYNGTSRNRIARLNTDGSLDSAFNPGSGADSTVTSIALQADGKVVVGGVFTSYNGIGRGRVARLNSDGSLDASFDPGTGANNAVLAIARQSDGKVLIGGIFTTFNGIGRSRIARLSGDGSVDLSFNPGTGVDNDVNSIAVQTDGRVLIAGLFTTLNGTARGRVARIHTDGSLDSGFNPGSGADSTVASVAVQADGRVLIGGAFTQYNGSLRRRVARLNANGSLDTSLNPSLSTSTPILAMAVQADGKIIIGGAFTTYNSVGRNRIARLHTTGSLDAGFDPTTGGLNAGVYSMGIGPDGRALIGGGFTSHKESPRYHIARLNGDSSLDSSFAPSFGPNVGAYAVAGQPDGKVLIGGGFSEYEGTSRERIARIDSNGSLDLSFNPGSGVRGVVNSIKLQADGKVVIAGGFTTYNGTARGGIARLHNDGSLDLSFDPGTGANDSVYSVEIQADGKILVAGGFTLFNGFPRSAVARLHTDGSLDTSFNPGAGANNWISAIALQADGDVLIGGNFTNYNGTVRNRIARLNADGSLDTSFEPGAGANDAVNSIVVQTDGKAIITGSFTAYNGTGRNRIARLSTDASLDTNFQPGTGSNNVVYCCAMQANGKIFIGGEFTSYNGIGANFLARLENDPATQSLLVPSASRVLWLRGGSGPEIEQVTFEYSSDGISWNALGAGTRVSSGWERSGLSLGSSGYLRARGRATGGFSNGSSSIIEQVGSYATPAALFINWTAASLLTGPDASPNATPHTDGVPNLLKYAFNLNGSGPDFGVLVPGTGTGGLPVFALVGGAANGSFRVEFLRRVGSGLIYTPKKSADLSPLSWVPLTAAPTVLPIDMNWERVIYEEPYDPLTTPALFGRVEVTLP
jgi:uncharacterized delta-60 repeat protein